MNWNVLLGTRRRRNITSSSLAVYDSLLRFVNENRLTHKIATPIIEAVGRNDKKRVISVRIRTPQQMGKTEDCHKSGNFASKKGTTLSSCFVKGVFTISSITAICDSNRQMSAHIDATAALADNKR